MRPRPTLRAPTPRARAPTTAPPRPPSGRRLLQYAVAMPKMKTHSGAKKRFKKTASGKLLGRHGMTSHILEKKSARRKRRLGRPLEVAKADQKRVKELLRS